MGADCPFAHETSEAPTQREKELMSGEAVPSNAGENATTATDSRQRKAALVPVSRPIPQQQIKDPRAFQISQIKTRFSATETLDLQQQLALQFQMALSDPDFPFEIDHLDCTLQLPPGFPQQQNPALRVTNKNMERGYQINLEKGFNAIWSELKEPTLLNAMKALDRQLETLLTSKKADTIKLVRNAGPPQPSAPKPSGEPPKPVTPQSTPISLRPAPASAPRKALALARRQTETLTLEHRLGKHPLFTKGGDGTIYTVPIEPRKRADLPVSLQAIKAVRLFVPVLYDVEPCTIELLGVADDAASLSVEKAFTARADSMPEAPLLAQVNYLAQNLHVWAKQVVVEVKPAPASVAAAPAPETTTEEKKPIQPAPSQEIKGHVIVIPRPPEWRTAPQESAADEESDSEDNNSPYDSSSSSDDDDDDRASAPQQEPISSTPREKGISVSFPSLELYGIELLELVSLSATLRCERCKDSLDVAHVRDNASGDYRGVRNEACKKCAFAFGVGEFFFFCSYFFWGGEWKFALVGFLIFQKHRL